MERARRTHAPEIHKQTDRQVDHPYRVLVGERGIALGLADDDVEGDVHAIAHHLVVGLLPGAQPRDDRHDVFGLLHGHVGDRQQLVALADARLLPRAARSHIHRRDRRVLVGAVLLLDPGDTVIGQMKAALLLKIDGSGHD